MGRKEKKQNKEFESQQNKLDYEKLYKQYFQYSSPPNEDSFKEVSLYDYSVITTTAGSTGAR